MSTFHFVLLSVVLVIALILSAFFSFAETSLMTVNRYRLRYQARLKKGYALCAYRLLKRPDRLLGVALLGNTFSNTIASAIATLIAVHIWGDIGALLSAIVLAVTVLIFTEVTPKTLAALYSEQVVRWVVFPVKFFLFILYPFVWATNSITNNFLKLFGIRVGGTTTMEALSREELRSIVYDTTGKLSRRYQNMLLGILDLNKLTVDEVMIPARSMVGINLNESWERILQQLSRSQTDWIPCYRESINQIVGVLDVREVLRVVLTQTHFNQEQLSSVLQEPYFIPEQTSLSAQLVYFQRNVNKIAFVVDEYGELLGLVTLYDILEEIVGDFTAELGRGKRIVLETDNSYSVEGAVTVREFNRMTEMQLPTSGAHTIHGLIVEHLEALPRMGVTVLIAEYPVEIVEVRDKRVKRARVFQRLPTKQ